MWPPDFGDSGDDPPGYAQAADGLVSRQCTGGPAHWSCSGCWSGRPIRPLGPGCISCVARWSGRGRDRLMGRVELDETLTAGVDEGTRGRHTERKTLIVIAAQGPKKNGPQPRIVDDPPDTGSCHAHRACWLQSDEGDRSAERLSQCLQSLGRWIAVATGLNFDG
jgi:hypothetical protein